MTLKRKFAEINEQLVVPPPGAAPEARTADGRPRTAPGQMLAFREQMNATNAELAAAKTRLEAFEGALPTRRLDPQSVRPSPMSNRHEKSFETAEFGAFKREIESAQGNVQPIKVRPLKATPGHYEIVFGHRRHRACLELGVPVLAVIGELSDAEMFIEMDRENRARTDLAPYELGVMYKRALEKKIWPSLRQMADALGVTHALISQALVLADLPPAVVGAFPSPLDLQYRWGRQLAARVQSDSEGMLRRAAESRKVPNLKNGKEVFEYLMGIATPAAKRWIEVSGKRIAEVSVLAGGRVTISFAPQAIPSSELGRLSEAIRTFVAGGSASGKPFTTSN